MKIVSVALFFLLLPAGDRQGKEPIALSDVTGRVEIFFAEDVAWMSRNLLARPNIDPCDNRYSCAASASICQQTGRDLAMVMFRDRGDLDNTRECTVLCRGNPARVYESSCRDVDGDGCSRSDYLPCHRCSLMRWCFPVDPCVVDPSSPECV